MALTARNTRSCAQALAQAAEDRAEGVGRPGSALDDGEEGAKSARVKVGRLGWDGCSLELQWSWAARISGQPWDPRGRPRAWVTFFPPRSGGYLSLPSHVAQLEDEEDEELPPALEGSDDEEEDEEEKDGSGGRQVRGGQFSGGADYGRKIRGGVE